MISAYFIQTSTLTSTDAERYQVPRVQGPDSRQYHLLICSFERWRRDQNQYAEALYDHVKRNQKKAFERSDCQRCYDAIVEKAWEKRREWSTSLIFYDWRVLIEDYVCLRRRAVASQWIWSSSNNNNADFQSMFFFMIEKRMISTCWCQSLKSHRADFIRWSDKSQCFCFQCRSLTFYATSYFVFYLRFVRPLHVQSLVMGRNIVKFIAQISHRSKYSSESVFSKVTAAIVNVIALHFAVSFECSAVNSECREVRFQHRFLLSVRFELRFVVIFDVFCCSSVYSQPSLLHLFLTLLASTFLARFHHIIDSSWRSLKFMLSSQTTSFSFWCSWKVFYSFSKFFNRSTLSCSDISFIHWSCNVIVF